MRATWGARPIFGPDLDLAVNRPDTKAGPFPTCIYQRPPGTPEQRRFFFIYMFTAFLFAAMFLTYIALGPQGPRAEPFLWAFCYCVLYQAGFIYSRGLGYIPSNKGDSAAMVAFTSAHLPQIFAMHAGLPRANKQPAAASNLGGFCGGFGYLLVLGT